MDMGEPQKNFQTRKMFLPLTTMNKKVEAFGGGGGVVARPKGVYEISIQGTRFIPANNTRKLIAALLIGILIKSLIKRR